MASLQLCRALNLVGSRLPSRQVSQVVHHLNILGTFANSAKLSFLNIQKLTLNRKRVTMANGSALGESEYLDSAIHLCRTFLPSKFVEAELVSQITQINPSYSS